jgi:SAM-dependent methyltransferase
MAQDLTAAIAAEWKEQSYYDDAERQDWLLPFWTMPRFRAKFDQLDVRRYVELACGHGRHTNYVLNTLQHPGVKSAILVDVVEENVRFCTERFAGDPRVRAIRNDGADLAGIPDASVTALFSYDAMVHFEYTAVLAYVAEAYRVLEPGGKALMHHSNYDRNPGGYYRDNPHWRNFMTKALFAHAAMRAGFEVLEQEVTHWNKDEALDCISLIRK